MLQTIISVFGLFVFLAVIVWIVNNFFVFRKPKAKINYDRSWNEVRRLRKDPSQMKSYDPDWVLRILLKTHPEYFAQRDIKQVLADCIPHDVARVKQSRVVSYDWYWIVELLPGHSPENEKRFVYIVGWFDPQLWEPVSHLKAWFFLSKESALSCAITGLEDGKWKREPDQKLYDFLKTQITKGEKIRRNTQNYWASIAD
jgi:hypothetical protein